MDAAPLTYDASLLPLLEAHLEDARKAKEARVADGRTDDNIPQLAVIVRGGKPVMSLWFHGRDSDDVANLLHMATQAFLADTTVLVFEGWVALTQENPETGKPWGSGGMDAWVAAHGGEADEVVGEGLIAFAVTADGRSAQTMRAFTILNKEVFFHPVKEDKEKEMATGGGYFVDAIMAAFGNQPEARKIMDMAFRLLGDEMPMSHKHAFLDVMAIDRVTQACDFMVIPAAMSVADKQRGAMLEILQAEWPGVAAQPEKLRDASSRASKKVAAGMN